MNFLMNYFQASVHASGYEDLIAKVDNAVARYNGVEIQPTNTEEPVTLTQAIAVASCEAVVETAPVEPTAEDYAEQAKAYKRTAYEEAAKLRKNVKKNPSKKNLKQLADLELFIGEFLILTDFGIVTKTHELIATYK